MQYNNYGIKSSKGVFYLTSKDKKDGYTAVETTKGTYYHKEVNDVKGVLVGASIKSPDFGGKQLCLFLEVNPDELNVVQVNLLDKDGSVESWAKEIAKFLPNLNLGDNLTFALNRTKKDKNDYLYKNMYINKDTDKVEWALNRDEVPKPKETPIRGGGITWDFKEQDDFYYDLITREVDRLVAQKDVNAQEPATAETPTDYDTLPF